MMKCSKIKESYQKFLDKYPKDEDPNDKMSESARMMLQMLDSNRSIEDIIKNSTGKDSTNTEETKEEDNKTDMNETNEKKEMPKDMNMQNEQSKQNDDGTAPNSDATEHPKMKNKK